MFLSGSLESLLGFRSMRAHRKAWTHNKNTQRRRSFGLCALLFVS
jgi:hypothetical protein